MTGATGRGWLPSVVGGPTIVDANILVKTVMKQLYCSLYKKAGLRLELQGRDSTI